MSRPRWIFDRRHVDEVIRREHERRRRGDPEHGARKDDLPAAPDEPDDHADEDPPVPRPRIY